MTSNVEISPTIFDRLLGTSYTPGLPKPPKKDSEFRYYTCYRQAPKVLDGNAVENSSSQPHKGMAELPTNSWACIQRGMGFFDLVHGSARMESYDKKEVRVCAYNLSAFDPAVLSMKIGAPVSLLVTPK
jgi:hypothetical protein